MDAVAGDEVPPLQRRKKSPRQTAQTVILRDQSVDSDADKQSPHVHTDATDELTDIVAYIDQVTNEDIATEVEDQIAEDEIAVDADMVTTANSTANIVADV